MTNALTSVVIALLPAAVGGKPIQFDSNDASEVLRGEMISLLVNHLASLKEHYLSIP